MKRQVIFFIGLAGLLTSGCPTNKIISRKPAQNIVIDGEYGDWNGVPLFYNKKPPFLFGATNTEDKINLILRTNDAALIRQMRIFGFTLWFNKDKSIGLQLPGRMRHRNIKDFKNQQAAFLNRPFQKRKMTKNDFLLIFKDREKSLPASEIKDFLFASGMAKGVYSLEFSLPLIYHSGDKYGVLVTGSNKIKLDLELNGFFNQQHFRPGGRRGNGMRGMGRGSGGREGAEGVNPKRNRKPQIETKDIWFEVDLSNT